MVTNMGNTEKKVTEEMMRLGLFDRLLTQIKEDISDNVEPLEELLTFVPFENLIGYLPEEEWKEWYSLRKSVIDNPIKESIISLEDVNFVCETINKELTSEEKLEVLNRFNETEQYDNWSIMVEDIIYDIISERT